MSLPLHRLHQLDALRGFVAVGRRMSITLAAADLCLTQSAVSRQIHALEAVLGQPLFTRHHRRIAFTDAGARLFRSADAALQQLQDVLGVLTGQHEQRAVTLSASIGTTSLWLLPRLAGFQRRHPDVDVRVTTSNQIADLGAEGLDLALRYTTEAQVPATAVRLFDECFVPVAHPGLGVGAAGLAGALTQHALIAYDDPQRTWFAWADVLPFYGVEAHAPRRWLHYSQYDQVIQAAVAGQGIALAQLGLVAQLLGEGRLEVVGPAWPGGAPGAKPAAAARAYWLVQRPGPASEGVLAVAEWLKSEAAATRRAMRPWRR